MDSAKLIVLVGEYEELYNLNHVDYSNQQRRDIIWEEIAVKMNQSSKACRLHWTRIRDNHRKALNLRKTKSGQSASKIKPPRFHQELQFLLPFYHEEEIQMIDVIAPPSQQTEGDEAEIENILSTTHLENGPIICSVSPATVLENGPIISSVSPATVLENGPIISSVSPATVFQPLSSPNSFSHGSRQKPEKSSSKPQKTTASVLDKYLKSREMRASAKPHDLLTAFFINMAETVKTFPSRDQIEIKGQVFQLVHSVELRLAQETQSASSWSSALTSSVVNDEAAETESSSPSSLPPSPDH